MYRWSLEHIWIYIVMEAVCATLGIIFAGQIALPWKYWSTAFGACQQTELKTLGTCSLNDISNVWRWFFCIISQVAEVVSQSEAEYKMAFKVGQAMLARMSQGKPLLTLTGES